MNIGAAIRWKYPDASPARDYSVVADPHTGEQTIEFWNLPDPEPTTDQLQQWWVSYLKDAKIAELNDACNQEILAGFTSSALGQPHTYGFDYEDQQNLNGQLAILMFDNTITSVNWKTKDAGVLTHTRDQFIQVCKDAEAFKRSRIEKFWNLKAQVQQATTEDQINAITW